MSGRAGCDATSMGEQVCDLCGKWKPLYEIELISHEPRVWRRRKWVGATSERVTSGANNDARQRDIGPE